MIEFYMFVTSRGNISAEAVPDEREAIDEARRLRARGETVLAIFRGGRPWLKDEALKAALS